MKKPTTLESFDISSRLFAFLLEVRPAELADFAKRVLGIKRQVIEDAAHNKLWIDPVSHFGNAIMRSGVYEGQMVILLQSLLRLDDVFVDVGGNEGYFSVIAAKQVTKGTVHCIEPQSRLQDVISKNIELNHLTNVKKHHLALSDKDGTVDLFLRPTTNSGSSSLFNHTRLGGKRETIPALTFGSFLKQNSIQSIRLMKIDCEGAEDLVIFGGKEIFESKKVDYIALEYHHSIRGREKLDAVHDFLDGAGYQLISVGGQSVYYLRDLETEFIELRKEAGL